MHVDCRWNNVDHYISSNIKKDDFSVIIFVFYFCFMQLLNADIVIPKQLFFTLEWTI